MSSRLCRKVEFQDTDDPAHPFRATVDGEVWQVRHNDVGSPSRFSLVVDGRIVESFSRWPDAWQRSVDGPSKLVKPIIESGVRDLHMAPKEDSLQPVERPPEFSVSALLAAREAEERADLARAERVARRRGKEEFSMARLEELLGGEAPDVEHILRLQYYVRHSALQTLAEFAAHLQEQRRWD